MRTFIRTAPKTGGFANSVRRNCGVISAIVILQYRVSKFAQPEDLTGRFYICPKAKEPTGIRIAEERPKRGCRAGAVCGRNAVRELVRSGRAIDKYLCSGESGKAPSFPIIAQARENKIGSRCRFGKARFSFGRGQPSGNRRACRREGIFGRVRYSCVCRRARRSAVYRYCRTESRIRTISARLSDARMCRSSRNNTAAQKKRGTYAHCVENIGGSA